MHQKKKTPSSADQLGHLGRDDASIKGDLTRHMRYSVGKDPLTATRWDWFFTSAHVVRDRLIERWMETMGHYYHTDAKRVYYLSLEFLIGRTLTTSLLNLGMLKDFPRCTPRWSRPPLTSPRPAPRQPRVWPRRSLRNCPGSRWQVPISVSRCHRWSPAPMIRHPSPWRAVWPRMPAMTVSMPWSSGSPRTAAPNCCHWPRAPPVASCPG